MNIIIYMAIEKDKVSGREIKIKQLTLTLTLSQNQFNGQSVLQSIHYHSLYTFGGH